MTGTSSVLNLCLTAVSATSILTPDEYISHGDCLEEAQRLAARMLEIARPRELILSMHEPLTGAHVGPGMLSIFFFGAGR